MTVFDKVSIELTREEYHEFIAYYNDKSTPASPILDKIVIYLLEDIEANARAIAREIVEVIMPEAEDKPKFYRCSYPYYDYGICGYRSPSGECTKPDINCTYMWLKK